MIAQKKTRACCFPLASVALLRVALSCFILSPCIAAEQHDLSSGQPTIVHPTKKKHVIGATATLQEKQSKLSFHARVDTGATTCSIHVVKMELDDEAEQKRDNVGKLLRFKVSNRKDEAWLVAKIEDHAVITTSDHEEYRYKVLLTLRWKEVAKEVLVTLNDRKKMKYPLLLGRNFLRGDFLVDVELDSDG